jgi:predicted RNA-binding Zn ribbon-like protein
VAPSAPSVSDLKLVGGELCLDFANTVDWHASDAPVERLVDYDSLVSWSRAAGILDGAGERRLRREAARNPAAAQKALKHAITIREALYRIFVSVVHGQPIDASDADVLSEALAQAHDHLRVVPAGNGLEWQWAGKPQDLEQMLWPVVRPAADLLTSDRRSRLGQCADDRGCGWLFLDTSKNHRRRWCAMEDCGNRAKAQRHCERSRRHEAVPRYEGRGTR